MDNLNNKPRQSKGKKTRFFVDNEYLEKGYMATFRRKSVTDVYNVLAKFANQKTQSCFPSIKTIMEITGIKRKNKISDAVKILEAYNMVRVFRSKGRKSNRYLLMDVLVWKEVNSVSLDTVIKKRTVSDKNDKWYQTGDPNGSTNDTRSLISKSYKEILDKTDFSINKKQEKAETRLSHSQLQQLKSWFPYKEEADFLKVVKANLENGVPLQQILQNRYLFEYAFK